MDTSDIEEEIVYNLTEDELTWAEKNLPFISEVIKRSEDKAARIINIAMEYPPETRQISFDSLSLLKLPDCSNIICRTFTCKKNRIRNLKG